MKTIPSCRAVTRALSPYPPILAALLTATLLVLYLVRAASGAIVIPSPASMTSTSKCTLSTQLQESPFREQYRAQLMAKAGRPIYDESAASSGETEEQVDYWDFGRSSATLSDFQTGDIDQFSRDCLSCHDGRIAVEVTLTVRNSPSYMRKTRHFSGKDHPIGMDYAQYMAMGRKFKAGALTNPSMTFIDGKVGCLTCHNPYNPERNHLVMSDRRSALCLTCHNK